MRQSHLSEYFEGSKKVQVEKTLGHQLIKAPRTKHFNNQQKEIEQPEKQRQFNKQAEEIIDIQISNEPIEPLLNVEFYLNQRKSEPYGDFIDHIHKSWWKNYKLLEEHHGFIQWLFPNAFKSRFNGKSRPLSSLQVQQFRSNPKISHRYVRSYMMILEFYGMKLKNKVTGEVTRSRKPEYLLRYKETLLTSFHNHMRISRILSSLVIVGLGRFAKQLSLFLGREINGTAGAMSSLRKYGVYERQWAQYTQYLQTQQDLNQYLRQIDPPHSIKNEIVTLK